MEIRHSLLYYVLLILLIARFYKETEKLMNWFKQLPFMQVFKPGIGASFREARGGAGLP